MKRSIVVVTHGERLAQLVMAVSCGLVTLGVAGCGADYAPPALETTGKAALSLGKQFDLEISLPHLTYPGRGVSPTRLQLRLDLVDDDEGQHEARIVYEQARVAGTVAPVEDHSEGKTVITISGGAWRSGRIGPITVDGLPFEFMVRGHQSAAGWRLGGTSWESQTGGEGSFEGWRRHRFLVAGTDYLAAGRVELVELVRGRQIRVRHALSALSPDPVLRASGDAVFAINRLSYDNIQRLDPERDYGTSWQASTSPGSNPQDLLLVTPGRVYLSRYEPPFNDLAIIDTHGGAIKGTISLAALAKNPDGTPRAQRLARAGGVVFVGLQDIDRSFSHYAEGQLAVIDPAEDRLVGALALPGKNPGVIVPVREEGREKLYVVLSGIYPGLLAQELSGGVAVVDVANRAFERWALDDDELGGNIVSLAVVSSRRAYVVVSDEHFVSRIVAFDPGAVGGYRTVLTTREYLPEIAADSGGVLAAPDRSFTAPALCLYRAPRQGELAELLLGCGRLELPPASVVSLDP